MKTSELNCLLQVARDVTSPSFSYVSNPAPDSSLCRATAPRLRPLQLLLPDCIDPLQLLLPDCIRFSCCSPLASASAAAPRLHPLQLLPDCICFGCCSRLRPLQLLLPDCIRFDCCSQLCPLVVPPVLEDSTIFSNIHRGVRGSVN